MGWSLSSERNEIRNARDEMEGKPTARGLAPAISTYIREMNEEVVSLADQDKQEVIMEAQLLDQAWGMWIVRRHQGGRTRAKLRRCWKIMTTLEVR
jgi:hypothetical protein